MERAEGFDNAGRDQEPCTGRHCGRQFPPLDGGKDPPCPFLLACGDAAQLGHGFQKEHRRKTTATGSDRNLTGGAHPRFKGDDPVDKEKRGAMWKILGRVRVKQGRLP